MLNRDPSKLELVLGYTALVSILFSFSLGSASVQGLHGAVPDFELTAARCCTQALTYIIASRIGNVDITLKREMVPSILYSGLLYVFLNVGMYGSMVYLPLVEAVGVMNLVTVITTICHSRFVFHKDTELLRLCAVGIMAVGIFLIVQPAWISKKQIVTVSFLNNNSEVPQYSGEENNQSSGNIILGYVLAVVGGTSLGLFLEVMRGSLHDVPTVAKAGYSSACGLVASMLISIYGEHITIYLTFHEFGLLVGHCTAAVVSNFCTIYAAHVLGGVRCGPILSLETLAVMVSQYTLMKYIMPGNHNWVEVLGAVILVVGVGSSSLFDMLQIYKQSNIIP